MSYGPPPPGNPGPPHGGGYGPPTGGYGPPPGGPGGPGGYGPPPGGQPGYGGQPGGTPPDNGLTWAIVSVFCCWPFAIPAIINAAKVNDLWNRGDQAGALEAQAQAKKWTKIAFILGSIAIVLNIFFYACAGVLSVSGGGY
ncbi:CD225/dispanin family protein [Nocardiopsis metallicus]|uniref:CD225/dispanin family protein n=1 Tax=Nocardiopsis metallicus TaxID=179819 RepID=A0A840W021_9ACTN|nr:CD225/dispanin family protein [Nocardiopsis metallicus]MBB5489314.1 hypothetical protein [Nocardiopsis metallicus]